MNDENEWVHFGQLGYEDFTKHVDEQRRLNYLKRSTKIKGTGKIIFLAQIIYQLIYYGELNFVKSLFCIKFNNYT